MPPDPLSDSLRAFATDPILLIGGLLPIVLFAGLFVYRVHAARRIAQVTRQNKDALDQAAVRGQEAAARTEKMMALNEQSHSQVAGRWQESAARAETMIALLTELRDHLSRIAPETRH